MNVVARTAERIKEFLEPHFDADTGTFDFANEDLNRIGMAYLSAQTEQKPVPFRVPSGEAQ